jgi:salicylate hydroxylase
VRILPQHIDSQTAASWVGPGRSVVHYPVRRGKLLNFAGVVERSTWRVESWSAIGQSRAGGIRLRRMACRRSQRDQYDSRPYLWALLVRRPSPTWSTECVRLFGAACHPMLPFMDQGATMAIEDGFILARAMERPRLGRDRSLQRL